MKKLIILTALITCLYSVSFAQNQSIVLKNFDKWALGFNLSANMPNGDARDKETAFNLLNPKMGYGIKLSKQISHFMGYEFNYNAGKLATDYSPYTFESRFKQLDGRIRINFTNGQILADYSKTQIYGFVGLGMINYQTNKFEDTITIKQKSDWVHAIPFGFGFKKRLGKSTSLNLEFAYTKVNTDMLDGFKFSGSEKDGYTNVNVGIQYTLGRKKKPLEWDEPLAYFKPLAEHSVDTLVIVKKETFILGDTTKQKPINKLTIYYDINDYLINGIYSQDLNKILNQLKENEFSNIEIMAFCDSTGSEKTNNQLVLKRSRLVADYFINNDISKERIKVYNYGMDFAKDPILSKDRRVVIKFNENALDKANSRWHKK